MTVGVLTVSDSAARGERGVDASGDAIAAWSAARGDEVVWRRTVADDSVEIVRALLDACDGAGVALLLTTGGTGLAPRDVTPEATRAVLERDAAGIAALLRASGRGALGRGVAGVRGRTLVVNLPGSPRAVAEGLAALADVVTHALDVLGDGPVSHPG